MTLQPGHVYRTVGHNDEPVVSGMCSEGCRNPPARVGCNVRRCLGLPDPCTWCCGLKYVAGQPSAGKTVYIVFREDEDEEDMYTAYTYKANEVTLYRDSQVEVGREWQLCNPMKCMHMHGMWMPQMQAR